MKGVRALGKGIETDTVINQQAVQCVNTENPGTHTALLLWQICLGSTGEVYSFTEQIFIEMGFESSMK